MPECDWAGNWAQAGVASLRPDPDLDLDLRVPTSHRGKGSSTAPRAHEAIACP